MNPDVNTGQAEQAKVAHPPKEGFRQEVSSDDLQKTNTRIQKARRIAHDIKPADGNQARIDELRDVERQSAQGDEAKRTGLEEMVLDTRGFKPLKFPIHYTDPDGKTLTEEVVGFTKQGKNGETDYLRFPDGKAVALNASLYITRLSSGKHPQGSEYDMKMLPRINTEGRYTGIVTLVEDKTSFESLQELANNGRFDGTKIRQELKKGSKTSELPAAKILADQLDRNYTDILQKAPNAPHQQVAFNLATRFYDIGLYNRISEQAMYGPKDYERFDDPRKLAPLLPSIQKDITEAEQTIRVNRPKAKITKENGWLYVDQGKHKTDYRIYLSPKSTAVGKVFSDLARTMPEKVKYQMKTFDKPQHANDVSRMDKIIVYCPEDDFDAILATVNTVYQQHENDFKNRPAPGGGEISPADGVSITKQPEKTAGGKEVTGTQQIADTIDKSLNQHMVTITKDRLARYQDATQASQSDEAKMLWSMMQTETPGYWYAGNESLQDAQKTALSAAYHQAIWNATLFNYTEARPITVDQVKQNLFKIVRKTGLLTGGQIHYLLTEKVGVFDPDAIQKHIITASKKTGLALAFSESLAKREKPSATFQQLLAA